MELKDIALKLGLAETASEADVTAKITELTGQQNQVVNLTAQINTLKEENDGLKLAAIEQLVDGAIAEKKVSADKKNHFIELGKKVGSKDLRALFAEMQPAVKLSTVIGSDGGGQNMGQHADAKKLSDLTPEQRVELKASDIKKYRSLYKAEYGVDCPV